MSSAPATDLPGSTVPTVSTSPGSALRSLRRLGPYFGPVRTRMVVSGITALAAAGLALLIPLVIRQLIDSVSGSSHGALLWWGAAILALGLGEAALVFVRRTIIARPTSQLEKRMREDLYAHLQGLSVSFHDRYQSGQLLSRAFSDLSTIRRFIAFGGVYLVVNALTLVLGIVILLSLSVPLGLIVVVMTVPMVVLCFLYESRFKLVARLSQDQVGDLATMVEESVLGIRVLKSFGRGSTIGRRFARDAADLRHTEIRKIDIISLLWATIIALPELALGAMLGIGAYQVAQGSLTLGTLVAAITTMTYLRWPIESIGWLMAEANNAASASDRYWEVMDTAPTIVDPPAQRRRHLPDPVVGHLVFSDVSFRYPGASTDMLTGLDFDVRPGETMALVGLSGSGKTTLTALVPRLYDVTGGSITIDGVDLRDVPLDELRSAVTTAFEDPILFSASVRENVALGLTDDSDETVTTALGIAAATDFTARLPWGLQTRIGEQGLTLSGGQRQRLALARAVAGHPAVLVLDDPLSALDVHTEAEVERALRRVLRQATALIVAHRPSTVALADRVALLGEGRLVAVGTHTELMATREDYRNVLSTMEDSDRAAGVVRDGGARSASGAGGASGAGDPDGGGMDAGRGTPNGYPPSDPQGTDQLSVEVVRA